MQQTPVFISCLILRALATPSLWGVTPLDAAHASEPLLADTEPRFPSESLGKASAILAFCKEVDRKFQEYSWGPSHCADIPWTFETRSERGWPLVYWEFEPKESPDLEVENHETTVILGGVHGDETPAIYVAFRLARSALVQNKVPPGHRLVIAPLVNPDGFFAGTRTNANGVDLNRNFPTADWWKGAHTLWKGRRKGSPDHFPGAAPATEQGTRFQMALLRRFAPDKVVSLHSPLSFIDYDGPGDAKKNILLSEIERKARAVAHEMARYVREAHVTDYPFFPGSLGNYSGNENSIPTITVEFASSSPRWAEKAWANYALALEKVVQYEYRRFTLATADKSNPFYPFVLSSTNSEHEASVP